ncbi:MAG: type II toxin-antitoxin system VapC family toxin [Candidatus Schekmanbacteria bacterium]|nr:type II toxin-antitoxin system VapC family toxin [Candidatus Schekmanbacteria bacterium]
MNYVYLIDTDWIIHYLNGQVKIVERLNTLRKDGLAISMVSLAELYEGIIYSKEPNASKDALKSFLTGTVVLDINEGICEVFGQERGKLRKQGKLVSDFDLLIASTCLYYNLTLLTNNRKHFSMVENLKIISLLR